jgi:nucleoside phosphorylase
MKKENYTFCFVFAMGVEARPFLKRVEVKRRWKIGHATHREVFFEGDMILVVRSGIGFEKALTATKGVQGRPTFILSVGTCGALTPDLSPGDLLIADETVLQDNPNERIKCSESAVENLQRACSRAGLRYKIGPIATATKPIFHRTERERLQHTSGAYAVDMESHAIATGASSIGSSFGVIRVVSDGMEAAPLPDRSIIKNWRKQLHKIPGNINSLLKWWKFLRTFNASVRKLDKPLVELTRIGINPKSYEPHNVDFNQR